LTTNEELAELDMRIYKDAQDDHDDESVILEEDALAIKRLN
jgi:hypothetical protein